MLGPEDCERRSCAGVMSMCLVAGCGVSARRSRCACRWRCAQQGCDRKHGSTPCVAWSARADSSFGLRVTRLAAHPFFRGSRNKSFIYITPQIEVGHCSSRCNGTEEHRQQVLERAAKKKVNEARNTQRGQFGISAGFGAGCAQTPLESHARVHGDSHERLHYHAH